MAERARLEEERRQYNIKTIIENLQEEVAALKADREAQRLIIRSHEDTINELRAKYYDVFGDKQQLASRIMQQDDTIATLRGRVAELEGKVG